MPKIEYIMLYALSRLCMKMKVIKLSILEYNLEMSRSNDVFVYYRQNFVGGQLKISILCRWNTTETATRGIL